LAIDIRFCYARDLAMEMVFESDSALMKLTFQIVHASLVLSCLKVYVVEYMMWYLFYIIFYIINIVSM